MSLLLLMSVLICGIQSAVAMTRTWKQPFGPRMCRRLCEEVSSCLEDLYDDIYLLCSLVEEDDSYFLREDAKQHTSDLTKGDVKNSIHDAILTMPRRGGGPNQNSRVIQTEMMNHSKEYDSVTSIREKKGTDDSTKKNITSTLVNVQLSSAMPFKDDQIMDESPAIKNSEIEHIREHSNGDITTEEHNDRGFISVPCQSK